MKDIPILQLGIESSNTLGVYESVTRPPIRYIHIKKRTMKNILFEKHYNTILSSSEMSKFDEELCAKLCANTTKEMMKGLADWITEEGWWKSTDTRYPESVGLWTMAVNGNPALGEMLTTEQLIELYLETLNQK